MHKNTLLILDEDAGIYRKLLEARNLDLLEIHTATEPEIDTRLAGQINIILGRPDFTASVIPRLPNLEWVQSTFAGVDRLCAEGLRQDYLLTGVKDIFGPLMSEFVFGYILAIERHVIQVKENQKTRNWQQIPYRSLSGLTIGVMGLGSIGKHIARTAHHFGMRVLGIKRSPGTVPFVEKMYAMQEIDRFLPGLDYLVAVLPETAQTRGFLQKAHFQQMKESAVFINAGRGMTVNQDDLVQALENNQIRGAVLDVFEQEPLPQSNPLWSMDGVYISPHNAAVSFPEQIADIFSTNYQRFTKGKELNFTVEFQRGY